jgi:cytochrome b561
MLAAGQSCWIDFRLFNNTRELHAMMSETDEARSAEALLGEAEPWEAWETKLVGISIALAIIGLIILGWLISTFILH